MQELLNGTITAALFKSGAFKFLVLGAMIGSSVAGSYAFKKAANPIGPTEVFFGLGIATWTITAICFVALLKTGPLGIWGPVTAVVQVAAVMAVSALFLNESYTSPQWIATGVSIAAMGVSMALAR